MNKTILKVTKTRQDAILPRYAHKDDSGLDLFSVDTLILGPGDFSLVQTGVKIELPPDTEAQIRPRSGLAYKNGITVLNSPGTIDEGYRGGNRGYPDQSFQGTFSCGCRHEDRPDGDHAGVAS